MKGERMRKPKVVVTRETAEALGAEALLFLAGDPARLVRFLGDTGIDPSTLRAKAGSPELLASVLAHLLGDESTLLVFTAGAGIEPEEVTKSHHLLENA
jgi:Protein of unknown function (DUF3572)